MPGSFHGIDLASRALRSFQRAMDVSGQNVANVNTRGYSRQAVDFAATDPVSFFSTNRQFLGTGVGITSVNRIRDMLLQGRQHQVTASLHQFLTSSGSLREVESVYNEPGPEGISNALDQFFNSWSGLASAPTDPAARMQVRTKAQTLIDRMKTAYRSLQDLKTQSQTEVQSTIGRINELATQVGELNSAIRAAKVQGASPNDLMDRRDAAISELSSLIQVNTAENSDGTMSVFASQFTLVDSFGAKSYPTSVNPATMEATDGTNTFSIRGGKLAGLLTGIVQSDQSMAQLDDMANQIRAQVNSLHRTGTNTPGTPPVAANLNFFAQNDPPALPMTGVMTLNLSNEVLSSPANIMTSVTGLAGDGGLALSISGLKNATMMGGKTLSNYHKENMAALGQQITYHQGARDTQTAIATQIENQQQAISGVSLDDEMANMLRFQRSYQAAARMLSIFDQVTEDLIGMVR